MALTITGAIEDAGLTLIGAIKYVEHQEKERAAKTTLTLEIDMVSGERERWKITIERAEVVQ